MAIYTPGNHVPISKALATGAYPFSAKYMYFTNGESAIYKYRAFQSVAEVGTYFASELRCLGDTFLVNSGGTLSGDGGVITGGVNTEYWYKDDLVTPVVKLSAPIVGSSGIFSTTDTGQSVINIPHGLAGTPTFYMIEPENANATNLGRASLSKDGTNVKLIPAYTNNDGATLTYLWEAKL